MQTLCLWSRTGEAGLAVVVGLAWAVAAILGWTSHVRPTQTSAIPMYSTVFTVRKPLSVAGRGAKAVRGVKFRLAEGGHEGGHEWYILSARVRIELSGPVGSRVPAEIDLDTDGRATNIITVGGGAVDDQPVVAWAGDDNVSGSNEGFAFGRTVTIHLQTYLQVRGIHGGENELAISVWHFGGTRIRSAELLAGTAVRRTPLGPPHMQLSTGSHLIKAAVGSVINIPYRITDSGFPGRGLGLAIWTSSPELTIEGMPGLYLGWVDDERGAVPVLGLLPGTYQVMLMVHAVNAEYGGNPLRIVEVRISAATSQGRAKTGEEKIGDVRQSSVGWIVRRRGRGCGRWRNGLTGGRGRCRFRRSLVPSSRTSRGGEHSCGCSCRHDSLFGGSGYRVVNLGCSEEGVCYSLRTGIRSRRVAVSADDSRTVQRGRLLTRGPVSCVLGRRA